MVKEIFLISLSIWLVRDPRISAIELAAKQLEAAGYKEFKIPQA